MTLMRYWRHDTQHNDTQQNNIQHYNKLKATVSITTLNNINCSVVMFGVIYAECCKQTHYAECHYAECLGAEILILLDGDLAPSC
jgi:hypothetical protein